MQDFHSSQNLKQMLRSAVETPINIAQRSPWKELSPSELCFWTRLRWASWMWTWTTMWLIWASECWRPCVYIAETHVLCPYLSNLTKLTNQIETEILLQIQIQILLQKKILLQRPSWWHFKSPQTLLKLPNRATIELCKTHNKIKINSNGLMFSMYIWSYMI